MFFKVIPLVFLFAVSTTMAGQCKDDTISFDAVSGIQKITGYYDMSVNQWDKCNALKGTHGCANGYRVDNTYTTKCSKRYFAKCDEVTFERKCNKVSGGGGSGPQFTPGGRK